MRFNESEINWDDAACIGVPVNYFYEPEVGSKDEKEILDEWYIRNASLWTDLRIIMMTVNVMVRSRLSSQEAAADMKQVETRNVDLDEAKVNDNVAAESRKSVA